MGQNWTLPTNNSFITYILLTFLALLLIGKKLKQLPHIRSKTFVVASHWFSNPFR